MVEEENKELEISPLVHRLLPDADEAELIEATANLRRFLDVVYDIYLRLEAEGRLPLKAKDDENEA